LNSIISIYAFHATTNIHPTSKRVSIGSNLNAIAIPNESFYIPDHEGNESTNGIRSQIKRKLGMKKNNGKPSYIHRISTAQEFHKIVEGEDEKIVVVRFYAHWCKTCKAMAPLFYRMAEKLHEDIVFVELEHSQENSALFQRLGVPGVPYGQIYHPTLGLMHEMELLKRIDTAAFEKHLKRVFFCT